MWKWKWRQKGVEVEIEVGKSHIAHSIQTIRPDYDHATIIALLWRNFMVEIYLFLYLASYLASVKKIQERLICTYI